MWGSCCTAEEHSRNVSKMDLQNTGDIDSRAAIETPEWTVECMEWTGFGQH